MFQNWLQAWFRGKTKPLLRKPSYLPYLEPLESRLAPIVGGPAPAPLVAAGGIYDGVVRVNVAPGTGTGSLLMDGAHILTAGHVVSANTNAKTVDFELRRFDGPAPVTGPPTPISRTININVPFGAGFQTVAPGPTLSPIAIDLGILRLTDQVDSDAGRRMIAPYYGPEIGYGLFNGDPVGQQFTVVGYGLSGTGAAGATPGTSGIKRSGDNIFDQAGGYLNNEVQHVGLTGMPSGGNFTLTITPPGGTATATVPIAWNAPAQPPPVPGVDNSVQTALRNALPAALQPGLTVTGGPGTAVAGDAHTWFISFAGPLGNTNVAQVTMANVSLVGGAVRGGTTRFQGGANEQQNLSFAGPPIGGAFTLTFTPNPGPLGFAPMPVTTGAIAWNANDNVLAANVQAALEAATNLGAPAGYTPLAGNVQVTAGPVLGTVTVTFINQLANAAQNLLTGDDSGLAGAGAALNAPVRTTAAAAPQASYGTLAYDFDNGATVNDAFGLFYGINQTGLAVPAGGPDGFQARGDSGGPAFIDGKIAGVVSYSRLPVGQPPDFTAGGNNSYGEIAVMVQAKLFEESFINPTIGGAYHLVLDMNYQMLGVDGTNQPLTITVQRNETENDYLEIKIENPLSAQFSGTYAYVPVAYLTGLTIRGAGNDDTIRLLGDLDIGPITIDADAGNDTIVIGDNATGTLDYILNNLTIDGGDGTNTLIINDVAAGVARTYTLDATSLDWDAAQGRLDEFLNIANLTLNAGNFTNTIEVLETNHGSATTINGGTGIDYVFIHATGTASSTYVNGGNGADEIALRGTDSLSTTLVNGGNDADTITVSSASNTLDGFGALTINGASGADTFNVNDQATTAPKTYTVTGSDVAWELGPLVDYALVENLFLNAGSGGNHINVLSTAFADDSLTTINSGAGDDRIVVGAEAEGLSDAALSTWTHLS